MTKLESERIATTTLKQLGGSGRLKAMIGAKHFGCGNKGELSFRFGLNNKMNYLKITLNSMDTYDLEFGQIKKLEYKVVKKIDGIYCDGLKEVIERTTGLYLSL
jgi:hypothetical protein